MCLVSMAVERLQVIRVEQTKHEGSKCSASEVGDKIDPDGRPRKQADCCGRYGDGWIEGCSAKASDGRGTSEHGEADGESVERVVVMILAGRDVEYYLRE
jgi:hypothetical protein